MKKKIGLLLLLASLSLSAAEYSLKLGFDPYRDTNVADNNQSADMGFSGGFEAAVKKDKLAYGLGFELRTETDHNNFTNYTSHPVYGLVKYDVGNEMDLLGRLGRAFNKNVDITDASGNYLAFGIGKSIGNFDLEFVHEATEIKNNDKDLNLKPSLELYNDGNLETFSFKVSYVLGREIDTTGPEITLNSTTTNNQVVWDYAVTERKAKITEVNLNGKSVPVDANGKYELKDVPTGRYTLEVVAVDKKGNVSRKQNSVLLVDSNSEEAKKELEEFVAGKRALPIIVGYEANVTELTPAQKKRLQDGVYVLDGLKGTLSVIGYTDDTGTEEINLMLSKQRAEMGSEMVGKVIKNPKDIKIETIGKGETNFKVPNDTDENRKLNRRIEFEFKSESGEVIASEEFKK